VRPRAIPRQQGDQELLRPAENARTIRVTGDSA